MSNIPEHWLSVPLNQVATVQSGGTPSRGIAEYWNGDIPWVKISDISDTYVTKTEEFITKTGLANSSAKIFPKGTILLTIFATIGRVGILKIDAATNQAIAGITPLKNIDEKFFYFSLVNYSYKLIEQGKGVAQKNINLRILKELQIPLPPLPEQKRIVAKLDTLFGHLDQLKARLDKIPDLLKQFRQSVLTQAVTGKLTKEWRRDEEVSAEELLAKIKGNRNTLVEKSEKHRSKPILASVQEVQPIRGIPSEWKCVTLASVCDPTRALTYGVIKLGQEVENGVPCLRTSDVRPLRIHLSDVKRISKEIADEYSRTYLKGGEILINVRGTLGGVAVASKEVAGYNVSREIAVAPILPILNAQYIAFYIASPSTQNWLMNVAKGIAYTGINIEDLINVPVPIPALEEQGEIARRVDYLFALADRIETNVTQLQKKIEQMPQAILSKAFSGELVTPK